MVNKWLTRLYEVKTNGNGEFTGLNLLFFQANLGQQYAKNRPYYA